jgi:hypothetical protein
MNMGIGPDRSTENKDITMAITIINAAYGTTNNTANVTSICQQLVASGNDDIPVNNSTMGGDPDPGVIKSFAIVYLLANATNPASGGGAACYSVMTAIEGQTIDLAPPASKTSSAAR